MSCSKDLTEANFPARLLIPSFYTKDDLGLAEMVVSFEFQSDYSMQGATMS